ncbi:PVC-type heme-binding CxxCH protein [Adhaeribacter radiodurans]|uniref:C-type cytochrome n=1 Tax=Adhaeribacter radiodurans TaxID=2745197 RepID=A0A7L7LEM2_9BACT|nr:PVC-type heme-binding CxxCH protein [Adhaeribacter radiodurans]QMU31270.1 c-type cytochrome [Adhaeribacter radiodurans]
MNNKKGSPAKPEKMPQNRNWRSLTKTNGRLLLGGLVCLSAAFSTNIYRIRPADDDLTSGFEVASGLEVKTFATEPSLRNPTNMDIDAKGRIWVCEGVNYRPKLNPNNKGQDEGDRILILEDTDGDGKADKEKVFYQGNDVNAALGIAVLGNKAIVSVSPNVFILTDTDGDDKADKKELLFTGLGGEQHDHAVHAFTFGPDGKLYFNFGNEGKQIKDKDGKPLVDREGNEIADNGKPYRQGMAFRCDMDGSNIEVLANNFRNNYEIAVDSYGTLWQSDNDDDGNRGVRINYVMPYGNYGFRDQMTGASWQSPRTNMEEEIPLRHWHLNDPGVVPNLLQTGAGSPTGMVVYEGNLLPATFQGQMIHSDAGPNVVRAYPVQNDGAGYKAEIVNILKTKEDKWFRPSDVTIAPDGSLFVADWYDPGVGGHQVGDLAKGRIFRIAPPGSAYSVPKLDLSTPAGAAVALKSPNLATRYLAYEKLLGWGKKSEKVLAKMFKSDNNPRFRARALWLLSKLDKKGKKYIDAAVNDADANIRMAGLRAALQTKMDVNPILAKLAKDASPQVRREVAVNLRFNKSPEAAQIWTTLANQYDGQDRWYLEALGIGADLQWDTFFTAWQKQGNRDVTNKANRDIIWRARTPEALKMLPTLITQATVSEKERPRYFRAFDFYPEDDAKQQILIGLLNSNNPQQGQIISLALNHIDAQKYGSDSKVQSALRRGLDYAKGKNQFVQLVKRFELKDQNAELVRLATTQPESEIGVEASKILLKTGPDQIMKVLNSKEEPALALITAMGRYEDKKAQELLEDVALNGNRSMEVRKLALKKIGRGGSGEARLLNIVKNNKLNPEMQQVAGSVLLNSYRQNIREEAAQYLKTPSREGKPLPPIEQLATLTGDPVNGKAVFSQSCVACHKVNGEGTPFGPELSEIGNKLPKVALYKSILHPDAGISFGYEGYQLKLKDGNQVTGIIASQTEDKLDLRQPGGSVTSYALADVVSKKQMETSLMPSNLQQTMSEQELVNLVEYLTTLKKASASN